MIEESSACREAALNGRLTFLNDGTAGPAEVRIYGGTRRASVNDAPGSPQLVSVTLQNPCGSVTAGVLLLLPSEPGLIAGSGVATWASVVNGDGVAAFDMDVGAIGSGAECIVTALDLYAGGLMSLVSAALS